MRCEDRREAIVLLVYDELQDEARRELESHLSGCVPCAAALEEGRRVAELARGAEEGPSEALLRRSRDELQRALRAESGGESYVAPRPWRFRLNPAWALALVLSGFVAGRAIPGGVAPATGGRPDSATGALEDATIANVDFHESDPPSDRVSLSYDTLRRTSLTGTSSDPRIRQVLVDTLRDNRNAGIRLEALDVLRRHADDRVVRQALLRAVREDDNAGARLKALEALKGHVGDDAEVRGAVVQALLRDTNPGVRVRAIDALGEARGPETMSVLRRLADHDSNEYVRLRSAALLGAMQPVEGTR